MAAPAIRASRKRSQVLPFTLTELLALLFFALALALVHQWGRRIQAEERLGGNEQLLEATAAMGPDASQALARLLSTGSKEMPDDFRELTRRMQSDQEVRAALRSELQESGMDSVHVDTAALPGLLDTILALRRRAQLEAAASAKAAGMSDSGRSVVGDLARELQTTSARLEHSERERGNLRGQVSNLQRRVGNGRDHPPCWADEAGNIEYAYQVTIRTNSVSVQPIWPSHRNEDARRIPGMMQLIGEDMAYPAFSGGALPVFEWSKRQEPECRHFVEIDDRVEGGKEAFKAGLLTVENFFYKLLLN